MKSHTIHPNKIVVIVFTVLTLLFVLLGYIIKSRYYHFPYPNLVEYTLSWIPIIVTLILITKKNGASKKTILLTGTGSVIVVIVSINLLNIAFEWHPLNLNPPFAKSQSFELDAEPYDWPTEPPRAFGYDEKTLNEYFDNLENWERLRSILIVKNDKLIAEKYFCGTTKYSAFNVHSITKSITSALIGVAIKHKYVLSENELVLPFWPEYNVGLKKGLKDKLNIKHLLSMRGGWEGGDGFQTAKQCILDEKLNKIPGTAFKYFTGSQNVLSAIITKSTNKSTKAFANEYLFKPLGIQNGFWSRTDGYYCGGDDSYYTARDLARLGQMYLNKGNVDGQQILDTTWIEKTFTNYTPTSKEFRSLDCYDEIGYGLCWWIFKTKEGETLYSARGKGGQHIILNPNKKIIIVVLQEWNPLKKKAALENKQLGRLLKMFYNVL